VKYCTFGEFNVVFFSPASSVAQKLFFLLNGCRVVGGNEADDCELWEMEGIWHG
jgi:hypothetical protein